MLKKWMAVLSPADEGTSAAAAAAPPPAQAGSFFSGSATAEGGPVGLPPAAAGEGDGSAPAAAGEGDGSAPPAQARPDWLIGKYATVEDQAKGYSELYRSYSKKTDDLRAQIKEEAIAEYGKTVGVPEKEEDYVYPEGFQAPDEPVDKALRAWARQNNVSPEGFKTLVTDVQAKQVADFETEKAKLGEHGEARVSEVNRWIAANVDKSHYPTIAKVMTTAAGVELMASLIGAKAERGFMPGEEGGKVDPTTREEIREMMADPKWGNDEAYTKKVRGAWEEYGKRVDAEKAKNGSAARPGQR